MNKLEINFRRSLMSGIAPFTSSDQTSLTTTETSSDNTSATSFYYHRRDGQVWLNIKISPGAKI